MTWIKIDEINEIYEPKYLVKEINNEIIENQNEKIIINDIIQINKENEIIKQKDDIKIIDNQEMDINEIKRSITNLNESLIKLQKDLNTASKNNKENVVENIKQRIKDIDNQKSNLFKIKQEKQVDKIKKNMAFKKESNKIYNNLPNVYNKDIKSDLEEKEDEKLALNSNQLNNKKKVYS